MKKNMIKILLVLNVMMLMVAGGGCGGVPDDSAASNENAVVEAAADSDVDIIAELEAKYNIEIVCGGFEPSSWDSVKCEELGDEDQERLADYLTMFAREFGKYSTEYVANSKLKRICFCKKLQVGEQYRSAVPDYYKEVLYYDIYNGYEVKGYHEDCVHHEYYHMVEEQINGDPYFKDPVWAAFNPEGFKYGEGGASVQGVHGVGWYVHPQEGFVSAYAMSGLEEDKASLFACLMVAENRDKVKEWAKEDKVLAKKVEYLEEFVKSLDLDI